MVPHDHVSKFLADKEYGEAANIVSYVCKGWLGIAGSVLAMLGVVAAPITSGDTALRSARLIIADFFKFDQKPILKRLMIALPMFASVIILLIWQLTNKDGFNVLWQYFGWSNQTLSVFTLWTITIFLHKYKKCYWVTLIPAIFMTVVSLSFILQPFFDL